MLSRFLAFGLMISIPVFAADECDPQVIDQNVIGDLSKVSSRLNVECPNQVNVNELCGFVSDQVPETDSSAGTKFSYQTKMYRAACIEPNDSATVIQAKIQNFWNKYHAQLNCNELNSSIRNAHILKLAVDRNANEFINDTVRRWKVNLNHVDTDHKTVLDFIAEEKAKAVGTPRESALNRYYQLFKNNGAKLQREL